MPTFIVKSSPTEDWYVAWSTVVDAPVANPGTRAQYASYGEDRLARADAKGTSMIDADWFGWDDETFITGSPLPWQGEINRSDLRAYVEAVVADDEAAMLAVCRPLKDE